MQDPIRSRILEDAKTRIQEQRDNARQCRSMYEPRSKYYAYWDGAYEWLGVALQLIDEGVEVS